MQLKDQVVFVTGGASGIGAACVKAVLERGAKVIIADINETNGKQLTDSFNHTYGAGSVLFVNCDVADPIKFKEAFGFAVSTFKQVNVMVNNAGVLSETNWGRMLDINLKGVITGTELALANMRKDKCGKGGIIVNVSSVFGYEPFYMLPVYVASKHGIIGYTTSMATAPNIKELDVRYACICPEMVDTPLFDDYKETMCRGEYYEDALKILSEKERLRYLKNTLLKQKVEDKFIIKRRSMSWAHTFKC